MWGDRPTPAPDGWRFPSAIPVGQRGALVAHLSAAVPIRARSRCNRPARADPSAFLWPQKQVPVVRHHQYPTCRAFSLQSRTCPAFSLSTSSYAGSLRRFDRSGSMLSLRDGQLCIVTVAVAEPCDESATDYHSANIDERFRAYIEHGEPHHRRIGSIPKTGITGTPKTRSRRNAAQDGAAAAQSRILRRQCKPSEINELRDSTALTALTALNRGPSPPGGFRGD